MKTEKQKFLEMRKDGANSVLILRGDWDFKTSVFRLDELKKNLLDHQGSLKMDFSGCQKVDFVFGMFLFDLIKERSLNIELCNVSENNACALKVVKDWLEKEEDLESKKAGKKYELLITKLGKSIVETYNTFLNAFNFCGMILFYFIKSVFNPKRFCITPLLYHINESGFKVLPVSILTVFIVGFAVALQGVLQLQDMGAPLMSVEMTAKLALREIGPFILTLVVAGRSASSFTAQIGVMKITEELDAMKTMGFNPFEFLVLPRVLALVIVLPLLVFIADAFAILGGMFAIKYQLDLGFSSYIDRFHDTVGWNHFLVGIVKAPFWGFAIAMVGCMRGFEVKGDTESIGRLTTISVVNALFWIIFLDAVFSIVFSKLNI
ncbi:ABC transporter permease [Helicobacter pylori]|uniref:Putative ABC transport system permease protein n=2 Tax=Helicobacter pylori TaxID=210 RepID=D7FBR5_HELP3|nr:ABC transporter permease [Helicobacter pylori]AVG73057.1 ABC transporter [Helicobacter pylori]AVG79100.1 ABC transporter permease [Helicobacter pylori]AVG80574.1 ABC transporter permease [Helicobacter pylori]AVG82059.1 ABC transporter [Helicobacter pylori]AVG83433.1 ABC transporter [Helicobacter pylori]